MIAMHEVPQPSHDDDNDGNDGGDDGDCDDEDFLMVTTHEVREPSITNQNKKGDTGFWQSTLGQPHATAAAAGYVTINNNNR